MAHGNAKYKEWLTDEGLIKIAGWCMSGATDKEIANRIGIAHSTLSDWKKKFPELSETLKRNKEVVDTQVENALLKSALGYEYEEETTFITYDSAGKPHKKIQKMRRHKPPDTTAGIFWLKNRKPDVWQNKPKDTKAKLQAEIDKAEAEAKLAKQQAERLEESETTETVIFVNEWDGEEDD